jgi:hypothetical protein
LHPKFYKPIFWDVKSAPNYTEKLILMGIAITTLWFFEVPHGELVTLPHELDSYGSEED